MTDASPRIFRTLEKSGGRDSFDNIVLAAVADYAALERPSAAQVRDFGRLVASMYERTGGETRRVLALSLSANASLPRALVERLLAEPVAVSAPFLLASPLLTEADLAALSRRREAGLKKILKTRIDGPKTPKPAAARRRKPASAALDTSPDAPAAPVPRRLSPDRQTALLSAGTPAPEPSGAFPAIEPDDRPGAEAGSAEEALALLRQLALAGRTGGSAAPRAPAARADLMTLALDRNEDGFHSLLANRLLLGPDRLASIRADGSGRELAAALKALGTERADALTMLMMLKSDLGADVAAFEAMGTFYAALDRRQCADLFDGSASAGTPALRPAYVETVAPHRAEPRRVFGRRTSIPGGTERRRRDG